MRNRKKLMILTSVLVLITLVNGCSEDPEAVPTPTAKQGLQGTVYFLEGNFMPPGTGTTTPVERELRVYELTTLDQVTRVNTKYPGVFISAVTTKLISTIQSDSKGRFKVDLPPGQYSLMVLEDDLLYANLFGGSGEIFKVEVRENNYEKIVVNIDYLAYY